MLIDTVTNATGRYHKSFGKQELKDVIHKIYKN